MPTTIAIAQAMKHIRYEPGTNAPGIKPTIKICLMDELKFKDALPGAEANSNLIATDILFREAVAAAGSNPAIPAGGCVEFEIAQKKNGLKMNTKGEDGYFYHEPVLEVMIPRQDATRSFQLELLNGCRVAVFFNDNNGRVRIGVNGLCTVEPQLDDNSNSYKVMFNFGIMSHDFFYYGGAIALKA